MHLIYLLIFEERKKSNTQPYFYIGSKSNCVYSGKEIIDSYGKPYYGSSTWKDYNVICKNEEVIKIHILSTFEDYNECLFFERDMHIKHDVVADTRFFNKSIATISPYSDPSYGTFRNVETGKAVRLQKDHPKVLNGEYVNANKGYRTYNNGSEERQFLEDPSEGWVLGRLEENILEGSKNPFYGKKHTEKSKIAIVEKRNETYDNDPERHQRVMSKLSETAKKTFTGVPKSPESNAKRGRKGMIMLKNVNTGETVRIYKEESSSYDSDVWQNPFKVNHAGKPNGSKWRTDGVSNLKIKASDALPNGFRYGRTYKKCNGKKRNSDES